MMLATMIEDMLRDLGCDTIKAGRVKKGLPLAETADLAGAILDINVGGEMVFPIARLLRQRGIPFIFSSGYAKAKVPAEFHGVPMLSKPFEEKDLEPLLVKMFASGRKG
jgi:DNA-binding response OmpR family regulator